MLHGEQRRSNASRAANLSVDVAHMVVDRRRRNHQRLSDLFVRHAFGQQTQHIDFPFTEARRSHPLGRDDGMSGRIEQRRNRIGIQPPSAGLGAQFGRRLRWCERGPLRLRRCSIMP